MRYSTPAFLIFLLVILATLSHALPSDTILDLRHPVIQTQNEANVIDGWQMLFFVIGGMGIFLMGMSFMRDGLQIVSGAKLRKLIAKATNNRILATLVGFIVTTIAQSSTVTTVIAIGFVNSGLMTLKQSFGIIIGANVGTTVTGWLIALNIGRFGLPILGIASLFYLFSKKEKLKYIALAIAGVGMIFFGIELMKNGLKPVRSLPEFYAWFTVIDAASLAYTDIILAATIGCILTMMVHSSAAVLAITISMAGSGMLNFETSVALILGQNIGTTITAFMASIGASTNARRASMFHIAFNVLGALWVIIIFKYYLIAVESILTFLGMWDTIGIEGQLAASHTIFNIINTIIFLPLTTYFGVYLKKIVKDKTKKQNAITQLDYQLLSSSYAAITQSQHEITKMARVAKKMFYKLRTILEAKEDTSKEYQYILNREEDLDTVQQEITAFLTELLGGQQAKKVAEAGKDQIRLADELESVSDYIAFIARNRARLDEQGLHLSTGQRNEILDLHERVMKYFKRVIKIKAENQTRDYLNQTKAISTDISDHVLKLREMHWHRIEERKIDPLLTTAYMDIIQAYRKIKNHLKNVVSVRTTGNYEKLEE
ncbi:MAG: Na/Pi cotransporter family protein [Fibrobacterales bacterium]